MTNRHSRRHREPAVALTGTGRPRGTLSAAQGFALHLADWVARRKEQADAALPLPTRIRAPTWPSYSRWAPPAFSSTAPPTASTAFTGTSWTPWRTPATWTGDTYPTHPSPPSSRDWPGAVRPLPGRVPLLRRPGPGDGHGAGRPDGPGDWAARAGPGSGLPGGGSGAGVRDHGGHVPYVSFDYLWWTAIAYLMIRLLKSDNPRYWLGIGTVRWYGHDDQVHRGLLGGSRGGGMLLTRLAASWPPPGPGRAPVWRC